jgi:prepilin peptidase CpaA
MKGFLMAAMAITAVAAWTDWRKGEIPNWLTLPALFLAPIAHAIYLSSLGAPREVALTEGAYSIAGAMATAFVPFILYRQSAIGGGDLKLLAALGALLKPGIGIEAEMYAFLLASLIAPARLAYEGKLLRTLKNAGTITLNFFRSKEKKKPVEAEAMSWFRLGPAIFIGTGVAAFLHWVSPD